MKILNLYAGIGGNRKLWGNEHEITAVEWDEEIAQVYKDHFPDDNMVVGDAHQYLLEHYSEFDFIWSSPPCPTHSRFNTTGSRKHDYPDMSLYQEIIFLDNWFDGRYVVENVIPYYKPLIPGQELDRHLFWSNFRIGKPGIINNVRIGTDSPNQLEEKLGYSLKKYNLKDRRKRLRNCVNPKVGEYILNRAMDITIKSNSQQSSLF